MDQYWAKYYALLKQNGLSSTRPRRQVFEALYSYGLQPMSLLIERCKESDRASVYRAVAALESIGVVVRIQTGFRYKLELSDAFLPHHHHISCTVCGRSREIEQSVLEDLLSQVAKDEGFQLTGHRLELTGICEECGKN